jgi:hypothetical protein
MQCNGIDATEIAVVQDVRTCRIFTPLPRSPALSYLQNQAQPPISGLKIAKTTPRAYPLAEVARNGNRNSGCILPDRLSVIAMLPAFHRERCRPDLNAHGGTPRGIRIAGLAGFAIGYRIHDGLLGLSDRNRLPGSVGAVEAGDTRFVCPPARRKRLSLCLSGREKPECEDQRATLNGLIGRFG